MRLLYRTWTREDALTHLVNNRKWNKGKLLRSTSPGYIVPSGPHASGPMMRTQNGGYIPAAFDPTDPSTYTDPVYFS
jgi:hypothetical protein